jgi:hypothetical protein
MKARRFKRPVSISVVAKVESVCWRARWRWRIAMTSTTKGSATRVVVTISRGQSGRDWGTPALTRKSVPLTRRRNTKPLTTASRRERGATMFTSLVFQSPSMAAGWHGGIKEMLERGLRRALPVATCRMRGKLPPFPYRTWRKEDAG